MGADAEVEEQSATPENAYRAMNVDGATAVVLLELGFPAAMGRGIFILSRSVGICAHAFEQSQQG